MTNKDFKELNKIISQSLSAHQRADWSNSESRKIVCKVIVGRFKRYLEKKNAD